jgi:hypothetical protein
MSRTSPAFGPKIRRHDNFGAWRRHQRSRHKAVTPQAAHRVATEPEPFTMPRSALRFIVVTAT